MNSERLCEKTSKCPIYSGVLQSNEMLTKTYKSLYCENGAEGKAKCRRHQVSQLLGFCPPNILPNSTSTAEEIAEKHAKAEITRPSMNFARPSCF
jgi:hypothetical protein